QIRTLHRYPNHILTSLFFTYSTLTQRFAFSLHDALPISAQRAQGELADLDATTAGRRDWRQAIFQRVAAPGAPEIPAGETADMLEQTYQSYKPAYEVIKGYPVMPRLFGRRSTSLETMLENVPKLNRVDAGDDTRKRVADGLRNAYSAFRRNLRTGENGEKLAGSEHYLRLRSRIRD